MNYGWICVCLELAFLAANIIDHDFNIFRYFGEVFGTNHPTPWSRVLLEKLKGSQLFKKFRTCYEAQRFLTAFTRPRHMSLSWATPIQSLTPSHFLKIHLNIVLPSRLGSVVSFLQVSIQKLCIQLSPVSATCPAQLILLDLITRIILGVKYRWLSSSLCSLLNSPVTSSLIGPNILQSKQPQPTFLPHYDRPCFTPIQNRQNYGFVHPNLYFLTADGKAKDSAPKYSKHSLNSNSSPCNGLLIRKGCSKTFDLFHPVKGFTINVLLYCTLMSIILNLVFGTPGHCRTSNNF
jgi:hypothetical protein